MRSWIVAGVHRGSGNDSEEANQELQTDREARRLSFALRRRSMALPRITARARRLMRLIVVIACFSFFGAAIFVIGMIIHSLGSVSFTSWRMFRDISGFFAIIGALYGSIIALDRSADFPWPSGKFFRRVNAPLARTIICSILGASAVTMVQSWHGTIVVSWLFVGAGAGAILGWFGWGWAKYVDF